MTTKIANSVIKKLCREAGFEPEGKVKALAKGWWSSAYSFVSHNKNYVVRTSSDDKDFRKDKLISQWLGGSGLPIPDIAAIGSFDGLYYAISERCEGYVMTDENINEEDALRLFECLWQMQQADTSRLLSSRLIDNGEDWQEGLLDFGNDKMDYTIEGLVRKKQLPEEVVQKALTKIRLLLPFCNTSKHLVHGDFGFDNALTDGRRITGIIDWAETRIGDFLYDVAYLIFNGVSIDYNKLWQQFVQEKGASIPNMHERLLCYQLVIGINSVAIAAHTNNEKNYKEDLKRLLHLL